MQAPDKIYIQPDIEEDNDSIRTWLLSPFNDNSVPYIRKKALLEWAKETYLSENASQIRKVCFKQLIDKLNSLWKTQIAELVNFAYQE